MHAAGSRVDGGRVPLLTDMEAPSVTVARAGEGRGVFGGEVGREGAKSGMRSAFMNMANSIM